MEKKQSIDELLGFVRRNLIAMVAVAAVGTALSVAFAFTRPPVYEASATVLIESQQIPDEMARSTVNVPAAARLRMIEQRLLGRDSLAALVERLGLYADTTLSTPRKVDLLRASTRLDSISASSNPWSQESGVVGFEISVALGDAGQAALVANELARGAVAQNVEVRSLRAQETLAYFDAEERRIASALAAAEAALSNFRQANDGSLPEDLEPNRATLARLETSGFEIERQMLELELRRSELEAGLPGGVTGATTGLSTSESELQRLELELATRRRVLAPNHPDLRRLQQQVDAVRALVASGGASETPEDGGTLAPRSASQEQQLEQIAARLQQLSARQRELAGQRRRLEAALVRNPEVEALLHALERQLEQLREQYSDVSRRQVEARTGANLEANQQAERFEILELALVPEYPSSSNRKKIAAFGTIASGGAAVGLALLLQMLRPTLYTSAQMERELDLRPIVAVPYVAVPGERLRRVLRWAAVGLLLLVVLWVGANRFEAHLGPLAGLKSQIDYRFDVGGTLDFLGLLPEAETPPRVQ